MDNRAILAEKINLSLSIFVTQIEVYNRAGLTNKSVEAECILKPIIDKIYNVNVINLNNHRPNAIGIDLIDSVNNYAFQITAVNRRDKIIKTIDNVIIHQRNINNLVIVILSQRRTRFNNIPEPDNLVIEIIDISDIFRKIIALQNVEDLRCLSVSLERELGFNINHYGSYGISGLNKNEIKFMRKEYKQKLANIISTYKNSPFLPILMKYESPNKLIDNILKEIKIQKGPIAENYYLVAQIYEMNYEYEKALDCYIKAYENAPRNIEFIAELSNFYVITGKWQKAYESLQILNSVMEELEFSLQDVATILEDRLSVLQQQKPKNVFKEIVYYTNLSGLFANNGNIEKANELIKQAYEHSIKLLSDNHKRTKVIKNVYESLQLLIHLGKDNMFNPLTQPNWFKKMN